MIASMILGAPSFIDRALVFPDRNNGSEFEALTQGSGLVRKTPGEARYATLIDLAARAKTLFADEHDDTNGKIDRREPGGAARCAAQQGEGEAAG